MDDGIDIVNVVEARGVDKAVAEEQHGSTFQAFGRAVVFAVAEDGVFQGDVGAAGGAGDHLVPFSYNFV